MIFKSTFTKIVVMGIIIFPFFGSAYADFPQTTVGVIDINYILAESKAAKDAAEKIEKIAQKIEKEVQEKDQSLLDEQMNLLSRSKLWRLLRRGKKKRL